MSLIPLSDAQFLVAETREHPTHVAGLLLFRLPADAGPDYVGDLHRRLLAYDELRRLYRLRPRLPGVAGGLLWKEEDDADVDLEYHVRLSALPRPGRVRELLELVSRLHGSLLDRHRPLWEFHLIEGLDENRFAVYLKVHHALVDGVRSITELGRMFTADPAVTDRAPLWAVESSRPAKEAPPAAEGERRAPWTEVAKRVTDIAGIAPAFAKVIGDGVTKDAAILPFSAPRTMFDVSITGARRFAAQSWEIARLKKVAKANGGTLNDVVLAMCAGALRRYLIANDALPDKSLTAAVPVALPVADAGREGGNNVTGVLTTLATHVEDPVERLRLIRESMQAAKATMAGRTALQMSAIGNASTVLPTALSLMPGFVSFGPTTYNVVISNVPGPRAPLYWNGIPVVGWYPISIPAEGQALNITVVSYADSMEFGLTGCRRSVPHLQRLLDYLEESLVELEVPDR